MTTISDKYRRRIASMGRRCRALCGPPASSEAADRSRARIAQQHPRLLGASTHDDPVAEIMLRLAGACHVAELMKIRRQTEAAMPAMRAIGLFSPGHR